MPLTNGQIGYHQLTDFWEKDTVRVSRSPPNWRSWTYQSWRTQTCYRGLDVPPELKEKYQIHRKFSMLQTVDYIGRIAFTSPGSDADLDLHHLSVGDFFQVDLRGQVESESVRSRMQTQGIGRTWAMRRSGGLRAGRRRVAINWGCCWSCYEVKAHNVEEIGAVTWGWGINTGERNQRVRRQDHRRRHQWVRRTQSWRQQ